MEFNEKDAYTIYCCDVETTGLLDECDVIELSMLRLTSTKNGFDEEQKTWCIKALNIEAIQAEALKINGHKYEDITWQSEYGKNTYKEPKDVIQEIELWMMDDEKSSIDRIFLGQNADYDKKMLENMWKRAGTEQTFPFNLAKGNRILDTKQLALLVDVCTGKRRARYDLTGLVKAFGIKKGKSHTATDDTKMTSDLAVKVISAVRQAIIEHFNEAYIEEK